jgi:hypothetical protein
MGTHVTIFPSFVCNVRPVLGRRGGVQRVVFILHLNNRARGFCGEREGLISYLAYLCIAMYVLLAGAGRSRSRDADHGHHSRIALG